jgi:hypothetical protein
MRAGNDDGEREALHEADHARTIALELTPCTAPVRLSVDILISSYGNQ